MHQLDVQADKSVILTATVIDDLNHPLGGIPLNITLKARTSKKEYNYREEVDLTGNLIKTLHLKPDFYDGYIEFSGSEYLQPARRDLSFEITKCEQETLTSPEFPLYIPVGETISFVLVRDTCLEHEAEYTFSASSAFAKQTLKSGESSVHIELDPHQKTPASLDLKIELAEGDYLKPEIQHYKVIYYDKLFAEPPKLIQTWAGTFLSAQYPEGIANLQTGAVLKDSEGKQLFLQSQADEAGKVYFALPSTLDGCYETRLFRKDTWAQKGEFKGEFCFTPAKNRYLPVAAGLAALILLLVAIQFFPRHRRPKLPKAPEKCRSEITAVPRFSRSERKSQKEPVKPAIICVDKKTGVQLAPKETTIIQGSERIQPESWPYEPIVNEPVTIEHDKYLPYHGHLRRNCESTIGLQSRRDYVIECFEAVSAFHHHETKPWGHETPIQLAEKIIAKDERKKEQAEKFCRLVSGTAFDEITPSDAELREIRMLAGQLTA